MVDAAYRIGFTDWLACAVGGSGEPAAIAATRVAEGPVGRAMALAVAGHILDFDDTYAPGLVHLSAPTAPVALVLGAHLDAPVGAVLDAYAGGIEAMAAVARASHPELYERGWHPTAVTGVVGAAVAASTLLGLDRERTAAAVRLALTGAGGLRSAFGADSKSLQVGVAAAQGFRSALLAERGVSVPGTVVEGFTDAYGAVWATAGSPPAVHDNWIKAYPCCLQTHGPIDCALELVRRGASPDGRGIVTVHPRSRQAAPLDAVQTGLEAKFSIPYTTALALLRGAPGVDDFAAVDAGVSAVAARIGLELDGTMGESAARLEWTSGGRTLTAGVDAALGSPQRPMDAAGLAVKVSSLAGSRLEGVLDDTTAPARRVLDLVEPV